MHQTSHYTRAIFPPATSIPQNRTIYICLRIIKHDVGNHTLQQWVLLYLCHPHLYGRPGVLIEQVDSQKHWDRDGMVGDRCTTVATETVLSRKVHTPESI